MGDFFKWPPQNKRTLLIVYTGQFFSLSKLQISHEYSTKILYKTLIERKTPFYIPYFLI